MPDVVTLIVGMVFSGRRKVFAMRVCWIKAGGFVPLDYGGRIRSFQMVKELASRHSLTVLTFYPEIPEDSHPALERLFDELILVPLKLPKLRSFDELRDYAGRIAAPHPYSMEKYYRPELRRAVADLFARKSFDVIVCDFIYPAGVLDWSTNTPIVLFTHNIEAEVWQRQYQVAANPLWKAVFWWEYRGLARAERRYAALSAHVLAVSESNRQFFGTCAGGAENVTLIPTGVDTDYFRPAPNEELAGHLVFTGAMDWAPNHDAMEWFYRDILPSVRASVPDVETWMVGRNPSVKLRSLTAGDDRSHITGRVDDVRPYLNRGSVFILPMRTGSGTRLKVFEAMAAGKAIVSTPTGAEGLPVKHEENILLASTAEEFASSVVRLLRDAPLRRRLGQNARQLTETGYSWKAATDRLEEALERVVQKNSQEMAVSGPTLWSQK
jgi:sugar transferase (PEP-CTERM/EpsH1 system associated)